MNSDDIKTREVEIELILPNWSGEFPVDCPRLDANYFFEDQRDVGRGLVVSEDMPQTGNIDQAIVDFLTPILGNAGMLKMHSPILRVAVYNRAYTCTLNIKKSLPLLTLFETELSITVYPTADDEAQGGNLDT